MEEYYYNKFSKDKITVRAVILSNNKILVVNQYTSDNKRIPVWTLPGGKYTFPYRCDFLLKKKLKDKVLQKTGLMVKVSKLGYVNSSKSLIVFNCTTINNDIKLDLTNDKNKDVISLEYLDINDQRIRGLHKIIKACIKNF